MRKNNAVTTVRIPEETKADMKLLEDHKFDVPEIVRDGIILAIKKAKEKLKKIS